MELMIDLETLSSRRNAAVMGLAAATFDLTGDGIENMFHVNFDLAFQRDRDIDPGTLYWWLSQNDRARRGLVDPIPVSVVEGLQQFRHWCSDVRVTRAWSYGASFDLAILDDLHIWIGMENPVGKKLSMCARTIYNITNTSKLGNMEGTQHHPMDDVVHQVHRMQQAWKKLVFSRFETV